ncbi:MAG: hypothetical protein HRT74_08930, partial [Flavobacteriales bacterium]|nr:hypothetical protein [Flavobacteriales bacterium]
LLKEVGVSYYLLRPLDLNEEVKDIDLVMPEGDVNLLVKHLISKGRKGKYSKSIANNSIAIVLENDVVLDIKTRVCFFKTKFLSLHEGPPFAIAKKENNLFIPDVPEEQLFTFWMMHFFLDKDQPQDSSTFELFKQRFAHSHFIHLNSSFCKHWVEKVFGPYEQQARTFIETYMASGFRKEHADNQYLQNLVLSRSGKIHIAFHLERIKYGIIRRIKRNLYRPLHAYSG